jgi:hypothetical protein
MVSPTAFPLFHCLCSIPGFGLISIRAGTIEISSCYRTGRSLKVVWLVGARVAPMSLFFLFRHHVIRGMLSRHGRHAATTTTSTTPRRPNRMMHLAQRTSFNLHMPSTIDWLPSHLYRLA